MELGHAGLELAWLAASLYFFYLSLPFFRLFEDDGWIPLILVISQMILSLIGFFFFSLSFVSSSHIVMH